MATDKFVVKNGLLVGTNTDDGINLVQVNGTISATNLSYSGTISGDGSGLTNVNATTLDSVDSTQFLRSDVADTKTAGNLSFSDNVRAVFGTGNDLQIFHDGSNSYIQDAGTGNLRIDASILDLRNATGLKTYASFVDGGAVSLRFNDATKLATTATGITVTGSVTASEIIAASTDLDITGNAIISGNLTVNGTTTSLNTTTVTTEDSVIVLNSGQTTPANDIGLILQRYSSPTTTNYNVAIAWDEGSDRLMFGATAETGADADITVSSEWMTITGAGNVGIGVTNPAFTSGSGLEIQRSGTATLRVDSLAFATELRGKTDGTELYQLSAGYLDLGTSGTTRMRITSGGNIGIGTTNPAYELDVVGQGKFRGDSANSDVLYLGQFSDNAQSNFAVISVDDVNGDVLNTRITRWGATHRLSRNSQAGIDIPMMILNGASGVTLDLYHQPDPATSTSTTNTVRLNSSGDSYLNGGNVGIGTYSPASLLHIASTGDAVITIEADTDNVNEDDNPRIEFKQDGGAVTARIGLNAANNLEIFNEYADSNTDIIFGTQNTTRMTIDGNGNVGIGNTNPTSRLVVQDTNSTIQSIGTAGYGSFYAFSSGTNSSYMFFANASSGDTGRITSNNDGSMAFSNTASNTERMRIGPTGNVGIGTTNPTVPLDIYTTTASTGLIVRDNDSWSTIAVQGGGGSDNRLELTNFGNALSGSIIRTTGTGNLRLAAGNTDAIHIQGSNQFVGIGTNNPTEKLHIKGGSLLVQTDVGTDILADFSTNVTSNGRIQLVSNAGNAAIVLSDFGDGTGGDQAWGLVANDRNAGSFTINWYGTSLPGTNITSGVEMFTIVGDGSVGNIGIGSTNPQAKLDVNGDVIVKSNITYTSPDGLNQIVTRMLDTDTLSFSGNSGQLFSITDSLTGTIFSVNDISGIPSIEVIDDGTVILAETFGNVLIGTATDDGANKLQLTGNSKITGNLEVTGTITGTFSGNITGTASNANLLDNLDSTQFLRSDAADSWNSTLTYTGTTNSTALDLTNSDIINVNKIHISDPGEGIHWTGLNSGVQQFVIDDANDNIMSFENVAEIRRSGNKVWDAGNDGSGSGLDADTVDGIQGASFLRSDAADTASGTITFTGGAQISVQSSTGTLNHAFETNSSVATYRSDATYWRLWQPNSQEQIVAYDNGLVALAFDGTRKLQTRTEGLDVYGNIYLTGADTTTNQARTIHFTGFDKETLGDATDAAYIRHTVNVGGHTGSVLEISSQNDATDGIAFITPGTSPLKHNSKNIPRIGVSDTPPGATNIVGDLWWDSNQGSMHIYYGSAWVEVNPYLGTTANPQFNSLGVGTPASGTTGEIRATNDVTAYYSDARLKTFEGTIDNAVDKVKQLNGYYFRENKIAKTLGYNNPDRQVGVSAQEVQTVLPEVVVAAPISDEYLTVKYEKMVPLLIEAIKEQQTMIDELRAEIENLKNKGI